MGRVHFGPSSGQGLGRVTVNAPGGDKVQVFLEGRYFGTTPMTIYSVPKGDYIVEGTYPDGRQVSRPVTVGENEEATVDLTAGKVGAPAASSGGMFSGDISPERLRTTRILLVVGAVALVAGVTFGILELKAENDYQSAPNDQATLDDIASRGKRDALLANVGYVLAGGCLIGAAIAGYPMVMKPNAEKTQTTAFVFAPVVGAGVTGGAFALRF
jgi:hypothetical protein